MNRYVGSKHVFASHLAIVVLVYAFEQGSKKLKETVKLRSKDFFKNVLRSQTLRRFIDIYGEWGCLLKRPVTHLTRVNRNSFSALFFKDQLMKKMFVELGA